MKFKSICLLCLILLLCVSIASFHASADIDFPHSPLRADEIPDFADGSDYYIEIHNSDPDFAVWQRTVFPFVLFSDLDDLGRTGPAYACLARRHCQRMSAARSEMSIRPVGRVHDMRISTAAISIIAHT